MLRRTGNTLALGTLAIVFLLPAPDAAKADEGGPLQILELRDGDRVAFLGNSFFERALDYGHIETSLTLRWPERTVTFRNLGWDGDTVYGHSRAGGRRRDVFGDVEEGFSRMIAQVRSLDPTVVFVAYGYNESFEGTAGVELFRQGLVRLLDALASDGRRFVLLSPTPMEDGFGSELAFGPRPGGASGPSYASQRNATLALVRDAIAEAAHNGGHAFVDLFRELGTLRGTYSENGIHPSENGYREIARIIGDQLAMPPPRIDLSSEPAEKIRAAIVKKNTLYFHRWRPRNDAFVYGERKDEQKIAQTEPEQFEPFIARQEELVLRLVGEHAASKP